MMHSGLYGKSQPRAFAKGNGYITLSDIGSHGQKTRTSGAHTRQYTGVPSGAADGGKKGLPALDGG